MLKIHHYFQANFQRPLERILPFVFPYWKIYLSLFLFIFVDMGITFGMAWFLQSMTDAALSKDFISLKNYIPWVVILLVVISAKSYLHNYAEALAIYKVKRDMKIQLFQKMLRLRPEQLLGYHSGELLTRLTHDINVAAGLVGGNLLNLIRLPLMTIAVIGYLTSLQWQLSLLTLSVSPVILISGLLFGIRLRKNSKLINENYENVNRFLNDVTAGFPIVRSFSLERLKFSKYKGYTEELVSLELKDAKLSGVMNAGASAASLIAYFLTLGYGSHLVASEALSVGSLFAFLSLMQWLVSPFTGMASSWSSFQSSVSAFERVWEVLGSHSEYHELPEPRRSSLSSLSIDFRNMTFSYDGTNHVLENLELSIPAGKVVAIVGPSGAGKSTLFKLLLGLIKPTAGQILFNDQPLKEIQPSDFYSLISYVPQEAYLFDGTIRENLLHGYPEATEGELIQAAKEANIYSFINTLPDRFDSKIGERGVRLSGGQKQRVSITRAILKNAPLLLLDEATSALDSENEVAVQESLSKLMKGRTTLVIAHRLSTIQNADWILVMDKGRIVAQGTHDALVQGDNPYSRMYAIQFRAKELLPH